MNGNLLANRLWAGAGLGRAALLAVAGSLFVALAAQVSVPMFPVPMTLQTLAVLAVGAAYGMRLGAATLALYALEGAVGLPVFANFSGGPHVIMGPTGGYIVGFILAAALVGWLVETGRANTTPRLIAAMLAGGALLYVPGILWLSHFVGADAVKYGLYPFVLGDVIKAVVAALVLPAASSLIGTKG